jgi:tryptophan synthase beta chain
MIGVEAAGRGITTAHHSATLSTGTTGVLQGTMSYLLQNSDGQIVEAHSIAPGLDYPGVGPEHSYLKKSGRVTYVNATDKEALKAFKLLSEKEGIIPALESAHAVAQVCKMASSLKSKEIVIINLSGRGDKDVNAAVKGTSDKGDRLLLNIKRI